MAHKLNVITDVAVTDVYEFKDVIGKGSYSHGVALATSKNLNTDQQFAIKVISRKDLNFKQQTRINREIEINGKISHPNIVKVFEVYKSIEEYCFVMELMKGGELFTRIAKGNPMTEDQAKFALKGVFEAVQYLHGLGIAHRDIKPENLVFQSSEFSPLKLIDFGFAKIEHGFNVLETPLGSPSYVAPEVTKSGYPYSQVVDMWSLGCILYFTLFSQPPFYSENEDEIPKIVARGKYDIPEKPKISAEAINLISHLLDKNPQKRFTATQALNHAWFTCDSKNLKEKEVDSAGTTPPGAESVPPQVPEYDKVKHSINMAIDAQREDNDIKSGVKSSPSLEILSPRESALWKRRQAKKQKTQDEQKEEIL